MALLSFCAKRPFRRQGNISGENVSLAATSLIIQFIEVRKTRRVMIHPSTQMRYIGDRFGYGVFATERIPRGAVVWAKDSFDQTFAPAHVTSLEKPQRRILETYGFFGREGMLVLCWDARRFLNHSCQPNTLPTRYGFEIAVRQIESGDQLTCDYASLKVKRPFSCHCQASQCRGVIHPEDDMVCSVGWSQQITEALGVVTAVEQPLWHLIDGERLVLNSASASLPYERYSEASLQSA